MKGRISELSDSPLRLIVNGEPRDFLQKDVREIRQWRADSLADGAVIGAGAGAGAAGIGWGVYCGSGGCDGGAGMIAGSILLYAGLGAAAGVGIDALIPAKRTIFVNKNPSSAWQLQIRPILNRSKTGVNVAFSF